MSHNSYSVNTAEPDRSGAISASSATSGGAGGVIFTWFGTNLTGGSIGHPSTGFAAGYNIPYYIANASYYTLYQGTGTSFNYTSYNPKASQYDWAFKDEVGLPAGDYELEFNYAPYGNVSGTVAWVDNDTSTRIGPIISTTTALQTTHQTFRFSSSSAINVACRILSGSGNSSSFLSVATFGFMIRKI